MSEPTIEHILEMQRVLDEQDVPTEGRVCQWQNEDGKYYEKVLDTGEIREIEF